MNLESISQQFSEKAGKLSANPVLSAITGGFLGTMVISLGVAFISVIVNLPIGAWQGLLTTSGLAEVVNDALSVTISMIGIYAVFTIGYNYAKGVGETPLVGAVLAAMAFFLLMPLEKVQGDFGSTTYIDISYMGSKGVFMSIILGVLVPQVYHMLMSKNIRIKLPDSVPPMVSTSFEPAIASMIIATLFIVLRAACAMLPGGNLFDFVQVIITTPVMGLAATPMAAIIFYTFGNLLWFLGVHPAALMGIWMPLLMGASAANTEAFLAGQPLPFLTFAIVSGYCVYIGGQGNTLALASLLPFAKSERYKSLSKLALIPNIFNINEPMVFGVPIILNPYYFVPMVASSLVSGLVGTAICSLGFVPAFNPTVATAWAMPIFVNAILQGGVSLLAFALVCFAVQVALYYPFFRMADAAALKEEQEAA